MLINLLLHFKLKFEFLYKEFIWYLCQYLKTFFFTKAVNLLIFNIFFLIPNNKERYCDFRNIYWSHVFLYYEDKI